MYTILKHTSCITNSYPIKHGQRLRISNLMGSLQVTDNHQVAMCLMNISFDTQLCIPPSPYRSLSLSLSPRTYLSVYLFMFFAFFLHQSTDYFLPLSFYVFTPMDGF